MTYRVGILNTHLKRYDRKLYATSGGDMVLVYRKGEYSHSAPIFILALTHDWLLTGTPTDWGVEPVIRKLCEMDGHRDDSIYDELVKQRNRREEMLKREQKNNVRAIAADMRREFARATNDINTSLLAKTDRRRIKDGHC